MSRHERVQVDGVLLLNKPRGFTSNQCLQQIKRIFNARKAGYTGTLDPLATGLLPIALGEATKFIEYAHEEVKTYRATGVFGEARDTGDVLGAVIATTSIPELTTEKVCAVLAQFKGTILQVPPMYSAVKQNGERLYDLARQGITVAREPREVTIYNLDLLDLTPTSFAISVTCSKGTYIRTLIEDIAKALGTLSYMSELCRTECAGFGIDSAIDLDVLKEVAADKLLQQLRPMESLLNDSLPSVQLTRQQLKTLYFGQPLCVVCAGQVHGLTKIYNDDFGFCGLVQINAAGYVKVAKLLAKPIGLI